MLKYSYYAAGDFLMSKTNFKDLKVYKEAKTLAVEIYKLTDKIGFKKDYGLRDQIQRSAVSIPSNIAEGCERETDKEFIRFLYIAKGSLAELITQLEIAQEVGYITKTELKTQIEKCNKIGGMLGALIRTLSKTKDSPKRNTLKKDLES